MEEDKLCRKKEGAKKTKLIEFDAATHIYKVKGKEVPSVTTICRFLSYDQAKNADQTMALMARERGTEVHEACAFYDYSGDIPDDLSADAAPYVAAYVQFKRDHDVDWKYIEHITGCNKNGDCLGYVGTLDRAGFVDGHFCVLDIKTSAKVNIPSLSAQLYGYDTLIKFENADLEKYRARNLGLQLMRDGRYRLYKCDWEQGYDLFNNCLRIHYLTEAMKGVRYAVSKVE